MEKIKRFVFGLIVGMFGGGLLSALLFKEECLGQFLFALAISIGFAVWAVVLDDEKWQEIRAIFKNPL